MNSCDFLFSLILISLHSAGSQNPFYWNKTINIGNEPWVQITLQTSYNQTKSNSNSLESTDNIKNENKIMFPPNSFKYYNFRKVSPSVGSLNRKVENQSSTIPVTISNAHTPIPIPIEDMVTVISKNLTTQHPTTTYEDTYGILDLRMNRNDTQNGIDKNETTYNAYQHSITNTDKISSAGKRDIDKKENNKANSTTLESQRKSNTETKAVDMNKSDSENETKDSISQQLTHNFDPCLCMHKDGKENTANVTTTRFTGNVNESSKIYSMPRYQESENALKQRLENISSNEWYKNASILFLDVDQLSNEINKNVTITTLPNFLFSHHIIEVGKDTTGAIVYRSTNQLGIKLTLTSYAVRNLKENSVVKISEFKKTNGTNFTDIVVVTTESTNKNFSDFRSNILLKIEFPKNVSQLGGQNWSCVYWNYDEGKFSKEGLRTEIGKNNVTCLSTHLSSFSLLLNTLPVDRSRSDPHHELLLTIISIVGSLITVPCLVLVIIVHTQKQDISQTKRILIHTCVALLMTHISFHVYCWLNGFIPCVMVNFMTHYSVLAFLLWTAFEGINMWRTLIADIFNTEGYMFYRWYKIISWGAPFLVSLVGVISKPDDSEKCDLRFSQTGDIILYFIPCTLILLCNFCLFIRMLTKIMCQDSFNFFGGKKLLPIGLIPSLLQVFNIGWCIVFPLLWLDATHLIGEYLFSVVISSQGILIFVARCLNDKTLRKKLLPRVWSQTVTLYISNSSQSRKLESSEHHFTSLHKHFS